MKKEPLKSLGNKTYPKDPLLSTIIEETLTTLGTFKRRLKKMFLSSDNIITISSDNYIEGVR